MASSESISGDLGKAVDGIDGASDFLDDASKTISDPVGALAEQHGIPPCLLKLGKQVLSKLSSSILGGISASMIGGSEKSQNWLQRFTAWVANVGGFFETPTEQGTSWLELDLPGFGASLSDLAGAFDAVSDLADDVSDALKCIKDFHDSLNPPKSSLSEESIRASFSPAMNARADLHRELLAAIDDSLSDINDILEERRLDPSLEPTLGSDDPGLDEEVFRLVYGPPLSQRGQYTLTSDGLYYDSQTSGLDPINLAISGTVAPGDVWKYDYDPNLGGRGDSVSLRALEVFKDNIFDINIIDDSAGLQKFYNGDTPLQILIQQRDKQLSDLSGVLVEFQQSYGDDSQITKNHRESIITAASKHNFGIDKRKKQIEVYVKVPTLYGENPVVSPGNVPINDFSLLEELNVSVDLEKQKSLTFKQGEVNGIVLPINPTFVAPTEKAPTVSYNHLNVPNVGVESITNESTSSAPTLSLVDGISTEGLVAIYNFLETSRTTPSSLEFAVTNSAGSNKYNNAQLAAANAKDVFRKGLGIPYLQGIAKNKSTDVTSASGMGSFYKLPDTKEFRELTYNKEGFTVEFWAHVPDLTSSSAWVDGDLSSLTKCVLASENVGSKENFKPLDNFGNLRDLDYLELDRGDQFVQGLIIGFTRDRRITQDAGYSNLNEDNSSANTKFFIAPTQSRDLSSASWINSSDCLQDTTYLGHSVDLNTTTNGKSFGGVSSEFVLCTITVDPAEDSIRFYADSELISETTVTESFGLAKKEPLNLPSRYMNNSFEYSKDTTDAPSTLHEGPKLNNFYTPWIVGGGYTDGMANHNNFLGGDRGGNTSPLNGHIGSMKFYSRAISGEEIISNYNTQKRFFKDIDLDKSLSVTAKFIDQYYGPPNEEYTTAHLFDFYEAKDKLPGGNPTYIQFYPGGGIGGSKADFADTSIKDFIDNGINVVAINYRLLNTTGELADANTFPIKYPWMIAGEGFGSSNDSSAAMLPINDNTKPLLTLSGGPETTNFKSSWQDAARIIQHLKYNHRKYGVDKSKIIVGGSSFGAVIANWVTWAPDFAATKSQTNDPVLWESTEVYAGVFGATAFSVENFYRVESFVDANAKGYGNSGGKTIYDISGSVYVPKGTVGESYEVASPTSGTDYEPGFKSAQLEDLEDKTKYALGTLLQNRDIRVGVATTYNTYDDVENFSDWSSIPGLKANHEQLNMDWRARVYWSGDRHSVSAGDFGDPTFGLDHLKFGKPENENIPALYRAGTMSTSAANLEAISDWKVVLSEDALTTFSSTFGVDILTFLPDTSSLNDYYNANPTTVVNGIPLSAYQTIVSNTPQVSAVLDFSGFNFGPPNAGRENEWDVSNININHGGSGKVINPFANIDLSGPSGKIQDSSAVGLGGYWNDRWVTRDVHDAAFSIQAAEKLKTAYSSETHQLHTSCIHTNPEVYIRPGYLSDLESALLSVPPTNSLGEPNTETFQILSERENVNWVIEVLARDIDYFADKVGTLAVLPDGPDKIVT